MEIPLVVVVLIIGIFSVIQSIFGVGLLVFGTPTFLLLGASYPEAVGYLLPSSLLLSAIQTHGFKDKIKIARGIILYSIPFVFIGMSLIVGTNHHSLIVKMIGIIMFLLSLIHIIGVEILFDKIKKFGRISLMLTGIVHGISNQGGAMLTILMRSIYSDKEKIRTNIAFAYLLFGLSQLSVLLWFDVKIVSWNSIIYGLVTLTLYQVLGKNLFKSLNQRFFNLIFAIFMIFYGILLIFTG
jgi:uncharacterized membrane protein YfcA